MKIVVYRSSYDDYDAKMILKTVRQWTELTQKDFCKVMNYSLRTIQSYEEGFRGYSFDTFLNLARKLDLKITIEKEGSINLYNHEVSENSVRMKKVKSNDSKEKARDKIKS